MHHVNVAAALSTVIAAIQNMPINSGVIGPTHGDKRTSINQFMILGEDERNLPAAFPRPELLARYGNEGRIECPVVGTTKLWISTGWMARNTATVVTVAHAFTIPPNSPLGNKSYVRLDAKTCIFARFNPQGALIEPPIPIQAVQSWWDKYPDQFGKWSMDFAVAKLSHEAVAPSTLPTLAIKRLPEGGLAVLLSHHNDVIYPKIARVMKGRIYSMPEMHRSKDMNPEAMFITDLDSNHGASGGIMIDWNDGSAFGMISGFSSPGNVERGEFNPDVAFNFGIYFTERMLADIDEVAHQ